ncbi:hypothetical protein F5Y10DRAFT_288007 [Nemania abortiva]|nr:hypothetical protein F5Y10DRAFT_288007 [Nemania abortiva]
MPTLTKNASETFVASVSLIVITSLSVLIRLALKLYRCQTPQGRIGCVSFRQRKVIFNVSHSYALDPDPSLGLTEAKNLAKLSYTTELLFGFGITTIKLSILWFYHNLFSVDKALQRIIRGTIVLSIVWFVVATLVIAFQCMPVEAYWENFDTPPYCLEYPRVLLGYELSNLLIDVVILCIPIGTVLRLHLPWLKKVPIIGIFLLGAVVCIFSIVRLTAIWNPPHIFQDFNFGGTYLWSTSQLGVAIVTSCLPTFGPLLPLVSTPFPYIRSWYKSLRSQSSPVHPGPTNQLAHATDIDRPWIRVGNGRMRAASHSWAYDNEFDGPQYVLHPLPPRTARDDEIVEVV